MDSKRSFLSENKHYLMKNILILFLFFCAFQSVNSQTIINKVKLNQLSSEYSRKSSEQRIAVEEYARINNLPIRFETDSRLIQLMFIDEKGMPQYYTTYNENAAKTISTNQLYSGGISGLNLSGSGITVYEWDGGTVRNTHQEFDTRVTNGDATATHYHSTHVAGTIMASGVQAAAKGMAFSASLKAYDWDDDESEMALEAASGALLSNHSYGYIRGWYWDGSAWIWQGNTSISTHEDYLFGFYDTQAKDWDNIAYNAPNYLIVKSAGNDRGDGPSDGTYPQDGQYDCIGHSGISKNVLTVGAVGDITGGWTQASDVVMSSFSSWGPADDGRIKPDIVANGIGLYSTDHDSDDDYRSLNGTSMSSPSVTGSVALLIQHYENVMGIGSAMRSATMKALIINTADEAGPDDGPDYMFGWGLMNTQRAAAKISENQTADVIVESVLNNGESYSQDITTTGTNPIKVTVVWTDPAGTPTSASLDPSDVMLVNDLDLRITQASSTFYPWKLDKDNPVNAATQLSENNVDNVEEVFIASPATATTYTITIDHDGTLSGGSQAFSMIISGDIDFAVAPTANFSADKVSPGVNQIVTFSDLSINSPTSWLWSFSPSTVTYVGGTSASSQNPQVQFTSLGDYTVQLSATNAYGSDLEIKTNYITASSLMSYCNGSGGGDTYISGVQIGTISNTNTGEDNYSNYTALSADLIINRSFDIIISYGNAYSNSDFGVWIDWNQDGDFDDLNENSVCTVGLSYFQETYSFTVPHDALLGSTTMRVRLKQTYDDCGSPCGATISGEVEDYKINVLPGSNSWLGINSEWDNVSNWSDGIIPNSSYNVIIPDGVTSPIVPSGTTAKCNSLTLENDAEITINGNLEVGN